MSFSRHQAHLILEHAKPHSLSRDKPNTSVAACICITERQRIELGIPMHDITSAPGYDHFPEHSWRGEVHVFWKEELEEFAGEKLSKGGAVHAK